MTESVVRALYGKAKSLNLSSKKINVVPECVSRLPNLSVLLLKNNSISALPNELLCLRHLVELNLGNNALKELPAVLGHLESLKKLYLFSNQITAVPPDVIDGLQNLVVLNLNHNHIRRLPPEMKRLRHLSVLDNKLEEVPAELGHLTSLTELNFTSNNLPSLPMQLYQCKELTKLHVARNKLTSLPEGIKALTKLQVLDVAGNKLSMFPVEELAARFVLQQDRDMSSLVHRMLPYYPPLPELLANGSCCALCLNPFLTTWLECVHFVSVNKNTHCLWRCRLDWPNICLDVQAHNPTNQPNERPAQLNVLQEYVG
ncbi:hypothetical protein F7725_025068 [Dissostichus mawsoni]|uniref:Leucine-rich repeat-containing protein 69 n=1 Tax=Dissostichus mawsoni TaxID=36200 RepID=A0A7J5XA30_DISMA|nr:hypothetical protein F7725_025068 [Dissostichus mawsoni]